MVGRVWEVGGWHERGLRKGVGRVRQSGSWRRSGGVVAGDRGAALGGLVRFFEDRGLVNKWSKCCDEAFSLSQIRFLALV